MRFRISDFGLRILIVFTAVLFFITNSFSQDVKATARVDSNHILIGDWLKLYLEVQHPKDVGITFPTIPDSVEGFEIVKREQPIVKQNDRMTSEALTLTMTSFDSGMHIVPPITIQYSKQGDTTKYYVETSPIPIMVGGITVDTTQDIKDVKPPLSVPITFADIFPYLIAIIIIGGVVWLILYILKKRKKGEPLIPEAPPRPANEVAIEALKSLESEKLWQRGKVKEYHSQLTDIIRLYIEKHFQILALESTSDEILFAFTDSMISKESKEYLKTILVRADLVKFAKFLPVAEENEMSLTLAYKFVDVTWHKEPERTQPAEEVQV